MKRLDIDDNNTIWFDKIVSVAVDQREDMHRKWYTIQIKYIVDRFQYEATIKIDDLNQKTKLINTIKNKNKNKRLMYRD